MASVTGRINQIIQPSGGYLPLKLFTREVLDDGVELYNEENIGAGLIGTAVDYLFRYMQTKNVNEAFSISLVGAQSISKAQLANELISQIEGLDDQSIISACKLVGFDVCVRAGVEKYQPVEDINPDTFTIFNIKTMVLRCLSFFGQNNPITQSNITFEGGYTQVVDSGDGDYLTADGLWDLKVSMNPPTTKHSLQLLMYYIMGKHSIHKEFADLNYLGIYNPRLNIAYTIATDSISEETICEVERAVICYHSPKNDEQFVENKSESDDLLTVSQVASQLGISTRSVCALLRTGSLPYVRIRGRQYVHAKDLDKYIEKHGGMEGCRGIVFTIVGVIIIIVVICMYL